MKKLPFVSLCLLALTYFPVCSLFALEVDFYNPCQSCSYDCAPNIEYCNSFRPKPCDVQIQAEFLYWQPMAGETDYVLSGEPSNPPVANTGPIGDQKKALYNWDPGVRVGITAAVPAYCCEIEGNYTFFQSKGNQSVPEPLPNFLNGTFPEGTNTPVTLATSSIHLDYQMGNVLLAKRFCFSRSIRCRLAFGGTVGYIRQKWNSAYFGERNQLTRKDWSFLGGGIRFGCEADWNMFKHLDLWGQFSTAILYGRYKNSLVETIFPPNAVPFDDNDLHSTVGRIIPHFQISFGPKYNFCVCGYNANLYALYELNILPNLQYVYQAVVGTVDGTTLDGPSVSTHRNSLIGIQGIVVGCSIRF